MSLRLKELQKVANNVMKRERSLETLQEELKRALGPTLLASRDLNRLAENANDRLDVLEASGKSHGRVGTSLLLKFADSDSPEVRKLVVRLLPENFLRVFMQDSNPEVRFALAKRLPRNMLKEMRRSFPYDEGLKSLLDSRQLHEAGLPAPEVIEGEFDMYGEEPLGSVFDADELDLSDAWYETAARKIVKMYGDNLEGQWEEISVKRFVDSQASFGVEVDQQKLLDIVYDILSEREEDVIGESSLLSLAARLRHDDTEVMPTLSEKTDEVKSLVSAGYTTSEYIQNFEKLFAVKHVTSPNPAKKTLREGAESVKHPYSAKLPNSVTRNVDERAVETYVTAWNTRETIKGGRNYKLAWSHDPSTINMVNFHLELK
jgi:hypothetical protein